MNSYAAGTAVTVTIPFVDYNGAPISAAGMTLAYEVIDENDVVIQASQALSAPASADVSASITIPGSLNQLGAVPSYNATNGVQVGNPFVVNDGLREIRLSMITPGGTIVAKAQYIIKSIDQQLVALQNSFQGYNLALLTASQMPALGGWDSAVENDRVNAMITAYLRLTKLGYFVRWPRDPDAQNYINWMDTPEAMIIPRLWSVMTTQRWLTYYPEAFRAAMRRAQIAEADQILLQDPLTVKRQKGVVLEKIGESTTMFRQRPPLDLGISRQALEHIQGYVNIRLALSRR